MPSVQDYYRAPNEIRKVVGDVAVEAHMGLKRPVKKQESKEAKRRRQSANARIQGALAFKVRLSKK